MYIFRIILLIGILFVGYLVVNQIRRRGNAGISPRQRLLRISSGITLIVLLGLVLAGNILGIVFTSDTDTLVRNRHMIGVTIVYASLALGLACLLVLLALLDIREVLTSYKEDRKNARRGMVSDLKRKDGQGQ
ncbi:MAG: hypothetical protein Q7T82_14010 [Armatimonadota bacterium]|nr:hypothetical protein [Armatimonadota bacterium]